MAGRKKKSSGTKKAGSKKKASKKTTTKKTTSKKTQKKSLTSYSKTKKSSSKSSTKKASSTKKSSKKKSSSSKKRKDWQIIPGKSMKGLKRILGKEKPKKVVTIKNNNRWHAKGKKSKVVAVVKSQAGSSHKARDKARQALPPGWRISTVTGKPYFENRQNRSDLYDGI